MLAILPESAARTRRAPAGIAWSFALHAGVAMIVTLVSGMKEELVSSMPRPMSPDTVIFIPMPEDPTGRTGGPVRSREPEAGPVVPAIPAPVTVPVGIVPPNPGAPHVELIVVGSADGEARRILGSGGGPAAGGRTGYPHYGEPWVTLDRAAVALPGNPRPRYPEMLRAARIEGRVVIDCVVDTSGKIEPSSVGLIESDHAYFTAAVHDVLPRLRFAPAEAGGRRVRQLVRIPFEFRLTTSPR